MRLRNWHKHPKADVQLRMWGTPTVTLNTDGTRTYTGDGQLLPFDGMLADGFVGGVAINVMRIKETGPINWTDNILRSGTEDGIWAFKMNVDGGSLYPYFGGMDALPMTPLALAIYTPEDWTLLQLLDVALFDAGMAIY